MKKLRRVILLLVLGVDLAILVVYWPALRPGKRHIYDRAGLIGWKEEYGNNQWLTAMQMESGVDIRIVVVPDSRGSTPEQFAVATMRELGIGRENGARGLLILYDTTARTVRIEVGPRLEGFLTDAFVGHMLRRHVDAFFNTGQTELGLRTILHMINWRIRQARLGREYDPSFEEYMRDVRRVAAGGGASKRRDMGPGATRLINTTGDTAAIAHFRPQPSVVEAYNLELEWLALGGGQADVPLFTRASRYYLEHYLSLSPMLSEYLLATQYGRRYKVEEREDLAMLYYTDDPFLSPKFFRRTPEGWQMDLIAEVMNSEEFAGSYYTWRLRVSGDDFSHFFADMYTPIPLWEAGDFYRVAGGDNRWLTIRGDSKPVESELDPHEITGPQSLIDGAPGVEYLTVLGAARRIRAAHGKPAVVLLYDYRTRRTPSELSDMVRLATRCRERGVEFLAFHSAVQPETIAPLPDMLRQHGAPFPAVQLYQWKSGMLDATMREVGIQVGTTWAPPLAAVLDREGKVVWQGQAVTDWAEVERAALAVGGGDGGTE
jgi:uncharacterized protein